MMAMWKRTMAAAAAVLAAAPFVLAQGSPPAEAPTDVPPASAPPVADEQRPATLDDLYAELAAATDAQAAMLIDLAISERLDAAGGPTAQLLSQRALVTAEGGNFALALELADAAVAFAPRYAEGFSTRATIHALKEDYGAAMADLQQALVIEPRHYRALANAGAILESSGDDARALEAYDKALALYPLYEEVRTAADALRKKIEGDRI
ncbi:MAG TPA: hypothetical protein PLA85_03065 [Micropepsaceae bacterium]|nr:hypothetical protein [Micropepsaceae bacterium]